MQPAHKLAEGADQREVQPCPHRVRTQAARQRHVGFQLRAVAFQLPLQEGFQPTAFVPAGFEVDHPTRTVAIHERAVNDGVREPAIGDTGQGELAVGLRVLPGEDPTPALVADGVGERFDHDRGGLLQVAVRDAMAAQVVAVEVTIRFDVGSCWECAGVRKGFQRGMHHGADVPAGFPYPGELRGFQGLVA